MKKIQVFIFFLSIAFQGFSQQSAIDSLKKELSQPGLSIDIQLKILKQLSKQDFPDGISKNIQYANKLVILAKLNNNYRYASDALDFLIATSNQNGNFQKAAEYAQEAIFLADENNNAGDEVYFSNLCGTANRNAANYYDALENYKYALKR
ncbi:MAG: hypothetical protein DRJ05_13245, partial [Bacteroidetes bacterium]